MLRSALIVTALFALSTGADAQRAKQASAAPYAPENDHSNDMNPVGSHSRSRSLDELVAMKALTSDEARRMKATEGSVLPTAGVGGR